MPNVTSPLLIPVHAATRNPATPGPPLILGNAPTWGQQRFPPDLGKQLAQADPTSLGITIRWLGDQTDNCLAAINPSRFHNSGADELARFQAGARSRGDTAVSLMTLFDTDTDTPRSVMSTGVTSTSVGNHSTITGTRIGAGTQPRLADDIDPVDRDLANRLLHTIGPSDRWLALTLNGMYEETVRGARQHETEGHLTPLLVTALGEPVAAAWTSDDHSERIYLLPEQQDWTQTLRWLVQHCLTQHAPTGLRQVRRDLLPVPAKLRSIDEQQATAALESLRIEHATTLKQAEAAEQHARDTADTIRDALLHSTGTHLVDAVATVLRDAGLDVEDLDQRFGDTISADLLATHGDYKTLIEVKSSNNAAGEDLAHRMTKHLNTWPNIAPDDPVSRGVLIVNHHIRQLPEARPDQVYTRPEFTNTLPFDVIATTTLLTWWLQQDWTAIKQAFGKPASTGTTPANTTSTAPRTPAR